jgi:hypothetical protein
LTIYRKTLKRISDMSKQQSTTTATAKIPHSTARKIREYAKKNGVTVGMLYAKGIEELAEQLKSNPVATVQFSKPFPN